MLQWQTLNRTFIATGLVVGLSLAQLAWPNPGSLDLEINAGLTQSLTLACTSPLSFGISLITLPGAVASHTLTLNAQTHAITSPDLAGFAAPATGSAGACTLSGSMAEGNQNLSIHIGVATTVPSSATTNLAGAEVLGLSAAIDSEIAGALIVNNFTLYPLIPTVDNGTFAVGADLVIPGHLGADGLGGYSATITVFVDDGAEAELTRSGNSQNPLNTPGSGNPPSFIFNF